MSTTTHTRGSMPAPTMENLGGGFYAFVQLDGSWGLNNAGVHIGDRGVTLVDTAFTVRRGEGLRDAVSTLTDLPVRTVVNTHHHGDHTYANALFPDATIISHDRCRESMMATGLGTTHMFPGVDWGNIDLVYPSVTFSDSITVHLDDVAASLRYSGRPAHTGDDVMMWVPEQGLLFAGDLVLSGATPFAVMGSIQGLIDTLRDVKALDPARIVPGHGPVCEADVIDPQVEYLELVQELARDGRQRGLAPLEVAKAADLGHFATWTDPERLVANLHRAYSELAGEPAGSALDYNSIIGEMVEFNGGQPLSCTA